MKDGYYQITYANLVAVLVQAMKEQQTEIEELKARIESLEGMLYQR